MHDSINDNKRGRYGLALILLALLLGACAVAHFLAHTKMDFNNRHFAVMDERTAREIRVVDFLDANLWIPLLYTGVFVGAVLWLEYRGGPRSMVWVTFVLLALPCLIYARSCLHLFFKFDMF